MTNASKLAMSLTDKIIVISQPWGGLGDNLQYSTLPELYSTMGYKVYISSTNSYRNPEIYDLVWKLNPYVSGVLDSPPNSGACRGYRSLPSGFTTSVELAHGLTNGYRIYPMIYYQPKLIPELSNCILYDSKTISSCPQDDTIKNSFESIFQKYPELDVKKIEFCNISNRDTPYFNHSKYEIKSIFDMCDAIYSCKVFVCFFSGSSVLASAIKQDRSYPEVYSFGAPHGDTIFYQFKNITYVK